MYAVRGLRSGFALNRSRAGCGRPLTDAPGNEARGQRKDK